MSSRRLAPLALVLVALACGEQRETAPPAPSAPAAQAPAPPAAEPAPAPEGAAFKPEFRKGDQLPADFPDDVPLYGNARPMSSLSPSEHGAIVNLHTADPAEQVFAWYRDQYALKGWTIEVEKEQRVRRTLVARKGNRVSSVVISEIPGATQVLLSVLEER